jgi:hypothetical protein
VGRRAMKRFVVIAVLASCSINHRSEQYACQVNDDCSGNRVCDNGFCIVAGSIDAAKPPSDARTDMNCPAPCTTCNLTQKTCTINCQSTNCTNNVITCPTGYRCDILCNVDNACRDGINCKMSAACNVDCTGKSSCEKVQCGPGPCDINCSGVSSCKDVSCANSCACDVTCTGNQSCQSGITCTSLACRSTTGLGCTSVPAFCHSCN